MISLLLLALAQVPHGHFVVSSFHDPTQPGGVGGLAVADPRVPGSVTPITGLRADLTGVGSSVGLGANSVLVDGGALWAGEMGFAGTAIDLHHITLTGLAVATDTTIRCGIVTVTTQFGGGIDTITPLPGDRLLLSVSDLGPPGPLAGANLAIYDPSSGFTVVPVSPAPVGFINGATASEDGSVAFYAEIQLNPLATLIYRVPLPGGGTPTRLARFRNATLGSISLGPVGDVICNAAGSLYSVDPVNGGATRLETVGLQPNGVALERATGSLVLVRSGSNRTPRQLERIDPGGNSTVLDTALPGVPSGVSVHDNPSSYGVGSPGNQDFAWQVAPNPTGLPRLGASAFEVEVSASGGDASGAVLIGLRPGSQPIFGTTLLLDPTGIIATVSITSNGRLALPIPANPGLAGVPLYCQSYHLDASLPSFLASSDGLWLTVLR